MYWSLHAIANAHHAHEQWVEKGRSHGKAIEGEEEEEEVQYTWEYMYFVLFHHALLFETNKRIPFCGSFHTGPLTSGGNCPST